MSREKHAFASRVNVQRRLIRLGEWSLLFVFLALAIWAATQRREAPQLILLVLLTLITINFSLPPSRGAIGLTPIVAVSSLLVVGLETAVSLLVVTFFLAEVARPLWDPMWEYVNLKRPSWRQRLGTGLIHLVALLTAGVIYQQSGGRAPLSTAGDEELTTFIALAISYGATYFLLAMIGWRASGRPLGEFFSESALFVFTIGFLCQPFALLGGIIFVHSGLPAFIIFCLGVMVFSIVTWLSWQRRFILEQQLAQFAALNRSGASLRETLDLPTVLARTCQQVIELMPVDHFAISLVDNEGKWQSFSVSTAQPPVNSEQLPVTSYQLPVTTPQPLDDFSQWVADQGRVLDLDQGNMHFAARHQLIPPAPRPDVWLGLPLTSAERVIGVMVLQRLAPNPPFSRWSREMLLTVAGQASAAIQNARLYSETVRLYNLTDEALARRVEQLQALLNAIEEGVLMVDTNGCIVLINPEAATLLEQPVHWLTGKQLDAAVAAVPLGYEEGELARLLSSLLDGQAGSSRRAIFQSQQPGKKSGRSRRFIERTETPVLAANQQVIGWLMLFRDVTEEHELAERRADLTRMIVHDLRNPLTTLTSAIDLVEDRLKGSGKSRDIGELLENARRNCVDMLDMVDSLMDINRLEAGQLVVEAEAMRLPPLVERVVTRLRPLATQQNIALAFACPADLPAVWADEEMIRRVLVNLLDNALKFTPAGGRIEGRLAPEPPLSPGYEVGVRCTIRDSGPGIPLAFRQQIFDRFMHTNRGGAQVRGTGLGLAFCKLAVEAHHGRIWVEDEPGGGSRFVFTLPGIPVF